jgi:acyl-CoA dehydrogenase
MDFETSKRAQELHSTLSAFLREVVTPAEPAFIAEIAASGNPHHVPAALEDLQKEARRRGLWNLFLPHQTAWSEPLTNTDYAPLAEITGHSQLLPELLNCSPPDAGNMELLSVFGTAEQKTRWLEPLLDARIRSCFAMTEPDVASSDATNISLRIERDGDEYVLNGSKWWITGAADPRCAVALVMGRSDPHAPRHQQHSIVLVPMDTKGLTVGRSLSTFGYMDREGHNELLFEDVRVPVSNILGQQGQGFAVAQARLGPGRIHHAMRAVGAAEKALSLMCERVLSRRAWGKTLAEQGVVREWIARSRIEIDQARLLTLRAAWRIDQVGAKAAQDDIAAIKVAVMDTTHKVIDRAIQAYGAAGVGPDVPLGEMYTKNRWLRIGDGPDEVHLRALARSELAKHQTDEPG